MENLKEFKLEYIEAIKREINTDFTGRDKIKIEIPIISEITHNYITVYLDRLDNGDYKIADNLQLSKVIKKSGKDLKNYIDLKDTFLRLDDSGEIYTIADKNSLFFNFNMFLRDYIIVESKLKVA